MKTVYYSIYLILILLGLGINKKRGLQVTPNRAVYINDIVSLLIVLFLVYLSYVKTNVADYSIYKISYNGLISGSSSSTGSGAFYDNFAIFCGRFLKLDFQTFKTILIAFTFLTYYWFAKKNTQLTNWVWGLLLIYPALILIIQFRFAFATAFLMIAVEEYVNNHKILCIIFLIISGMIHTTMLAFFAIILVMLLYKLSPKHNLFLVLFLTLVLLIFRNFSFVLISKYVDLFRADNYLLNQTTGLLGFILYLIVFIVNFKISEGIYLFDLSNINYRIKRIVYFVTLFNFWTIPFVLITPDFMRYVRITFIMIYVVVATLINVSSNKITILILNHRVMFNIKNIIVVYTLIVGCFFWYMYPQVVSELLGA